MKKQTHVPLTEEEAKTGLVLMRKVLSPVPSSIEQQVATFAKEPAPTIGWRGSLNPQGFSLLRRNPWKRG